MLALFLSVLALSQLEPQKPLPEMGPFLAEFRKTLHLDEKLLSQYTYTQTETELSLDGKGNTRKTETNVYEVINGPEEWQSYQRQTVKKGVPVSEKELEKSDRENKEQVEKEKAKRDRKPESKIQEEREKENREEQEVLEGVFAMYDLQMLGREVLDGRSTVLITFKPRPGFKPKTKEGKNLYRIAGRVWVSEEDYELARMEGELVDSISFGAGILAKLHKGSAFVLDRRKINNEIWLPVRAEVLINARVLLLKGINVKEIYEYTDHKKYSVETQLKFGGPAEDLTP